MREDTIPYDDFEVDVPWEEDPCEEVVNNINFWLQEAYLDRKFHILHRIHKEGVNVNGALELFKLYWPFVCVRYP